MANNLHPTDAGCDSNQPKSDAAWASSAAQSAWSRSDGPAHRQPTESTDPFVSCAPLDYGHFTMAPYREGVNMPSNPLDDKGHFTMSPYRDGVNSNPLDNNGHLTMKPDRQQPEGFGPGSGNGGYIDVNAPATLPLEPLPNGYKILNDMPDPSNPNHPKWTEYPAGEPKEPGYKIINDIPDPSNPNQPKWTEYPADEPHHHQNWRDYPADEPKWPPTIKNPKLPFDQPWHPVDFDPYAPVIDPFTNIPDDGDLFGPGSARGHRDGFIDRYQPQDGRRIYPDVQEIQLKPSDLNPANNGAMTYPDVQTIDLKHPTHHLPDGALIFPDVQEIQLKPSDLNPANNGARTYPDVQTIDLKHPTHHLPDGALIFPDVQRFDRKDFE